VCHSSGLLRCYDSHDVLLQPNLDCSHLN
jgi:hypothetical protein